MKQNKVVIISGATATGKTAISIALAKQYHFQIINFDSLLFYRELNIGTAKPALEEMGGVIHHLINIKSITEEMDVAQFCHLALEKINDLHDRQIIPLLVGGSAFYLQALLYGIYEGEEMPQALRKRSDSLYQQEGIAPFLKILQTCDPPNYQRIHKNDHYRIRRAVEYYWSTGRPFSQALAKQGEQRDSLLSNIRSWNLCHLYLSIEKKEHWKIIAQRSEQIADGLVEEVSGLLQNGLRGNERPLLSIGHKEAQKYLSGEIRTRQELVERISIRTRQLAKGQKTFFAQIRPKLQFNPLQDEGLIRQSISDFLQR